MTRLAVIILNWNGAKMLSRFLPSVVEHTTVGQVWVADNGSTDDSMALLRRDFPTVHTLPLDRNYGFAEGYNRAIASIEAEVVVLLNSDVRVTPGWDATLLNFMDAHPDVAAVQPKILCEWQPTHLEYAGAAGGFIDQLGYPYCRGRVLGSVEEDHGQYDTPIAVHWATGAALMVRRNIYIGIGGLDTRFFAHMEEIDLCWRLRNQGHLLYCVPQSVVYHLGGGTLPQGNPRKTFLNFRNNLLMIYKNHATPRRVLLCRLFLDAVAAVQFLLTGQWGSHNAVWRAWREFLRMRRHYPPGHGHAPLGTGSILWQYYIKRHKTWQAFT